MPSTKWKARNKSLSSPSKLTQASRSDSRIRRNMNIGRFPGPNAFCMWRLCNKQTHGYMLTNSRRRRWWRHSQHAKTEPSHTFFLEQLHWLPARPGFAEPAHLNHVLYLNLRQSFCKTRRLSHLILEGKRFREPFMRRR